MITVTLNIPSLEMKHKGISYCILQNVNMEALLEDMELDKISDDDFGEFLSHFEMNVTKSMDKHASIWTLVKKVKDKNPGIIMN